MFDYAVVGSGVGGSSSAALLQKKGYRVALFEKDRNLGGCSSSFYHNGFMYNTGATTLAGYQEGHIVKEIFDEIGFMPVVKELDIGMLVLHNSKTIKRYSNLELFIEEINRSYPHPKHRAFWTLVSKLNKQFYKYKSFYYSNKNSFEKISSLFSFIPMAIEFSRYLLCSGENFIQSFYSNLDSEYKEFLEAQVLIVTQAKLKDINFLTAAVALAYTFNKNYHVEGGFSKLFEELTAHVDSLFKNHEVLSIKKDANYFELETDKGVFQAKRIILNSTIYDSAKLFQDEKIKKSYTKYKKLDNSQSAFVFYMTLKSEKEFEHHYQIIKNKLFSYSISNSIFVSFSNDFRDGYLSITASIHTDYRLWYDEYTLKKDTLEKELYREIISSLGIDEEEVVDYFSATPMTFIRFIRREQIGGNPITMSNFLSRLPSNDTNIPNLFQVGDTTFAAQGWPGVMLGVKNLIRLLDV